MLLFGAFILLVMNIMLLSVFPLVFNPFTCSCSGSSGSVSIDQYCESGFGGIHEIKSFKLTHS